MHDKVLSASRWILVFPVVLFMSLQAPAADKIPVLKNGIYKFNLLRPDGNKIVFNATVKDSYGKKILYVMNGEERLLVDSITTTKDSVFIEMPFFDSRFRGIIKDNGDLRGVWIKDYGIRQQTIPFEAIHNLPQRFTVTSPPAYNISGRWKVNFTNSNNEQTASVGEFVQTGSHLTGTFLFTTGDYRFLEGVVSGDSLYLSAFDGSHAFLFTAVIKDETHISDGHFYSGYDDYEKWNGNKNAKASLSETANTVEIKPGAAKLNFTFPALDGTTISISDKRFKDKVVVIQLLGSWCPNCLDETRFLVSQYDHYRQQGVEFIGIAYERTDDFERSKRSLQPFINKLKIPYPVVIAPVALSDSLRTEKTLPQIGQIPAFPTTIFVDKKGEIRKIHSGFDGPATGIHFDVFKKEFDALITELINEK